MEKFEKKMKKAGLNKAAIDAFRVNYEQLTGGATGMVGNFCIIHPQQRGTVVRLRYSGRAAPSWRQPKDDMDQKSYFGSAKP